MTVKCMVHGDFYKQLGYDLNEKVAEGLEVLRGLYGRSENDGLYQQV